MKVVAITINKGGVGKTMMARSLAAAAAASGRLVMIVDLDTQQNATTWRRRRDADLALPLVEFSTENDLERTLARAREAGCELVLIDTPPGRSTEAPAAVEVADLVLIPCSADIESFEGLPRTARLARTTGRRAVVVPNLVQPNSKAEADTIREVAATHEVPTAPVALHRYAAHREASLAGRAVQEIQPDSKAGKEIVALWNWLCAELQMGTGATVHKRRGSK